MDDHAAQSRKHARGHTHLNQQRRPRHMLSGLLRCGACGAGMSANGKDNSGRIRIRCSAATESGFCRDAKTFYLKTVESAVLAGLENEMRHPQVIAEYVRTYHEKRKRLSAKANAKRAHLAFRLGELNREIDRLVDAIAKGHGDPAVLGPRSSVLNEERKRVTTELNLEPAGNDTISLHPAISGTTRRASRCFVQRYRCRRFRRGRGDQRPCRDRNSLPRPLAHGGLTTEIAGRLNALLGEQAYPNKVRGVWEKMVAEDRYSAIPTYDNALFSYRRRAA